MNVDDVCAAHGTMGDWRDEILRGKALASRTDALSDASTVWKVGADGIMDCVLSGRPFRVHGLLSQITRMLSTVCDIGPARVDPTPLLVFLQMARECADTAQNLNRHPAGKFVDVFLQCTEVNNRLLFAWIAFEGGDQPNLDDDAPDGPWGLRQWRHAGRVSPNRMTSTQFELAQRLFDSFNRPVSYDAVCGPGNLFEDPRQPATIQRHCSNISKFFLENDIPLTVTTDRRSMTMQNLTAEE